MATTQSGKNVIVSYKVQGALGSTATGAGGTGLQIAPSPGFSLRKAIITDPTVRRDGQTRKGRHGSRTVEGSYNVPLRVGEIDTLFAALLQTTSTAAVTRTYDNSAGLTSLEITGTSTITQVGTTTLLGVVAKGDVITLGGMSTAANNDIRLRVTNVTATVITVAGTPLTIQAADIACTLTVHKKIKSAATLTKLYYTFDEYLADIDVSDVYTDVRVSRFKLTARPNEIAMCEFGLVGLDGGPLATGSSPSLTSPTFTTTLALELASGKINIGGTDYADVTGVEFEINLNGQVPGVLAPNAPDVFLGNSIVSGQVTCFRPDSTHFTSFDNETAISLALHFEEPETAPKDFVSFYIGNASWAGQSNPKGDDGALIQTLPFIGGIDEDAGTASDTTTSVKMCTSAA